MAIKYPKPKKVYIKLCYGCGNVYIPKHTSKKNLKSSKYCGEACRHLSERPNLFIRKCENCEEYFIPVFTKIREKQLAKFCSRDCSGAQKKKDLAERFWAKVDKSGDCWIWQGGADQNGYGYIYDEKRRKNAKAHRVSYEIANRFSKPIPPKLLVCHKCDNPPCVRPDHLFLGTNKNNMEDMVAKGRQNKGEKNGQAKVTAADVIEMKRLRKLGATYKELGDMFGLEQRTASMAVRGVNWKHLHDYSDDETATSSAAKTSRQRRIR